MEAEREASPTLSTPAAVLDADGQGAVGAAVDAAVPESVGRYIARQRQLRGISLQELSASTRIPLRSLERLETGQFDGEADGFVRGFVRTVADALGLDPNDTVLRMLTEVQVDDDRLGRVPSLARLALAAGLLVVLALALAGTRALFFGESVSRSVESERVVRRDPVRALAEMSRAAGTGVVVAEGSGRSSPLEEDALLPPPAAAAELALP